MHGKTDYATQASTVRSPSRLWIILFATLLQTASLSQLPFLQDSVPGKVALAICEFLAFLMLVWKVRGVMGARRALWIAAALVAARFLYAWAIAHIRYEISFAGALQEGRFGYLILITPAAFVLFRNLPMRKLGEVAACMIATLVVADVLAAWFFARPGYIAIGGRSASRYVISVIPLLMFTWMRMNISIANGLIPTKFDIFALVFAAFHIVLFSTSRSEAVICAALIAQWLYIASPNLRWPLLGAALLALYMIFTYIQPSGDAQVAGRDYRLAVLYSRDALPFGVGLVPESIQKQQLGTAGNFFASDYGPILLIYRYGVIGFAIALGLLAYWLRFFIKSLEVPGGFIIAIGILIYFMIVPLLDYGSMVGGLLLGAMATFLSISRIQDNARPSRS